MNHPADDELHAALNRLFADHVPDATVPHPADDELHALNRLLADHVPDATAPHLDDAEIAAGLARLHAAAEHIAADPATFVALEADRVTTKLDAELDSADIDERAVALVSALGISRAATSTVRDQGTVVAAEAELYALLRQHDFAGPAWETTVAALTEHASRVLTAWIGTGTIYRQLDEVLMRSDVSPDQRTKLCLNRDYREEIVEASVVEALTKLQRSLRTDRGWHPRNGRSLRTYFITECLFQFPRVYRQSREWLRPRADPRPDPRPDRLAMLVSETYFAALPEPDQIILWATVAGYTAQEVADLLPELTLKAIARRRARLLRRIRGADFTSVASP